jgi:hypothetical protein
VDFRCASTALPYLPNSEPLKRHDKDFKVASDLLPTGAGLIGWLRPSRTPRLTLSRRQLAIRAQALRPSALATPLELTNQFLVFLPAQPNPCSPGPELSSSMWLVPAAYTSCPLFSLGPRQLCSCSVLETLRKRLSKPNRRHCKPTYSIILEISPSQYANS